MKKKCPFQVSFCHCALTLPLGLSYICPCALLTESGNNGVIEDFDASKGSVFVLKSSSALMARRFPVKCLLKEEFACQHVGSGLGWSPATKRTWCQQLTGHERAFTTGRPKDRTLFLER